MTRKVGWMVFCCLLLSLVGSKGAFGAEEVVAAAGILAEQPGICLDLGCGDGKRAAGIASETGMFVFALAKDEKDCEAARETLEKAGLYGTRATVMTGSLDKLPFPKGYGNLVVVGDFTQGVNLEEVGRVLNPNGVAAVGGAKVGKAGLETALKRAGIADYKLAGDYAVIRGKMPEGSDDWTHYKHGPGNNPVSSETTRPPFRTQWVTGAVNLGHPFNYSVAVVQGRLIFSDGMGPEYKRLGLYAMDAFNGTPLWDRKIKPPVPLAVGMVTVGNTVYVIDGGDKVLALDAATGRELKTYRLPEDGPASGRLLKVSVVDDVLCLLAAGSVKAEKLEGIQGPAGDLFCALSVSKGNVLWRHPCEKPVSPYWVALGDAAVYFHSAGWGTAALDMSTGKEIWKETESLGFVKSCWYPFQMPAFIYHNGRVCLFHSKTVVLDAKTGKVEWTGASLRSLFIGDRLCTYERYGQEIAVRDVASGAVSERLKIGMGFPGCGYGTGDASCIFSSGQGFMIYDLETKQQNAYNVFRTNCGGGPVPANGLLFALPHACGCGYPIHGATALAPAGTWQVPDGRSDLEKRFRKGPAYSAPLVAESPADEWPCYRHDSRHSAVTQGDVRLPLAVKWQQKLSGQLTPPSVGGGMVYVASDTGHVWALDGTNGKERWNFLCGAGVPVTPAYWQGRLLVGSQDGWVYCLEAKSGKVAWCFQAAPQERYIQLQGRMISTWPVQSGVVLENGIAYFAAGMFSYDAGYLYAMDIASGRLLWVSQIGHLNELRTGANIQGAMALNGGLLFIPGGGDKPCVFKKGDGSVAWWHGRITGRLTHDYVGYASGVQYGWFFTKSGGSDVVVEDDRVLFGGPRLIGDGGWPFVICEADSGWPYGTQEAVKAGKAVLGPQRDVGVYYLPSVYASGHSTPIVTRDRIFVYGRAYNREKLEGLHLVGGKNVAKAEAEAKIWSAEPRNDMSAAALAGSVLIAADGSQVAALNSEDGKRLNQVNLPGKILRNGLAVGAGRVYAVTTEGSVLCLTP